MKMECVMDHAIPPAPILPLVLSVRQRGNVVGGTGI